MSFRSKNPILIALIALLLCAGAGAATLTVTNLNDTGTGSLRGQIGAASAGDTINFQSGLAGSIALSSQLVINKNLTIGGPASASTITVSGGSASRVFSINPGVTATIQRLTIANGDVSPSGNGGGVLNNGVLTLDSVIMTGNRALNGGAIFGNGGSLSVIDSSITGSSAASTGGGIYASSGAMSILRTTVAGSTSSSSGGGLYVNNAAVTVLQSTFSGNSTTSTGGGLALNGAGTLTIANSTLSGNSSSGQGAGAFSSNGTFRLTNVTITANQATGLGGGLATNSTVHAINTIISGNTGASAPSNDLSGTLSTNTSSFIGGNALLGALANNGFSTRTHALLTGSPAIGAGNTAACSAAPVSGIDQRGLPRPSNCSIGAYEPQAAAPTPTTTSLASSQNPSAAGASVTFTATVSGAAPTGTVEFREGAAVLGSSSLNGSGQASFATAALSVGDHSIVAAYLGDSNNAASTSAALVQSVGKIAQTITFNALPSRNLGDPPFTVAATASSGLPVSFASQTTSVCTVAGSTVTLVASGACTIRATQAGDASYAPAPPVDRSFSVVGPGQTAQTITFSALPSRTFGEPEFNISATASSGLPVLFTPQTPQVCTVSSVNTVIILAAGTCTIRAEQSGNVTFAPAPSVDQSFTVDRASQTITFPALADQTYGQAALVLTARSDQSGLDVDYTSDSPTVCSVTGSRVTSLAGGTCTIRAKQEGNANFLAAPEVTRSFNVIVPPGVVTFTYTPQRPVVGQEITFQLGVGGSSPSGTVELLLGNQSLGSAAVNAGQATFSTRDLPAGNHLIKVRYSGDGVNPASESPGFGLAVSPTNVSSSGGGGGCAVNPRAAPEASLLLLLLGAAAYHRQRQRRAGGRK